MIQINIHISRFFFEKNQLSAARLFFFIKDSYNNHIHKSDFNEISKKLDISINTIYSNLKSLEKLGICTPFSKGYWRIKSWRKWCNTEKNRKILIKLEDLKCLKRFRSFFYALCYRAAQRMNRKNSFREPLQKIGGKIITHRSGLKETSASFVKKVTKISKTLPTILRQLKNAEDFGFILVTRSFNVIYRSKNYSDCLICQKHINKKVFIKKRNGYFYLIEFNPNLTEFFY